MPTIRFVREGRDVKCAQGANLRSVALSERLELYGLKGKLGNCGGCGQCITCFVSVISESEPEALSPLTEVEKVKLRGRPSNWRLACQTIVNASVIVMTKPQAPPSNANALIASAMEAELSE